MTRFSVRPIAAAWAACFVLSAVATAAETDAEAVGRAFAERLDEATRPGGTASLTTVLNPTAFVERIVEIGGVKQRRAYEGAFDGFDDSFLRSMRTNLAAADSSYHYLRTDDTPDGPRVMMRLLLPNGGGVNYHQWYLPADADEESKAVDMYMVISGEMLSKTIADLTGAMMEGGEGTFLDRIRGKKSPGQVRLEALEKMRAANGAGDGATALAISEQLDPTIRKNKAVVLMRLQAASQMPGRDGERRYSKVIEEYRELFPGDVSADFVDMDRLVLAGRNREAIEAIDRVNKVVRDPYMDYLAGELLLAEGEADAADRRAVKATREEPTLEMARWLGIMTSMAREDFEDTLDRLKAFDRDMDIEWSDLRGAAPYAPFVASPQFAEWEAYLEGKD